MVKFSANISTLYTELPFLDRFSAAKEDGFDAVEFWFPYEHSIQTIRTILADNELELVGMNSHSGDEGDWGLAAVPGREADFANTIEQAVEYAGALGSRGLHVMAGLVGDHSRELVDATYLNNLERALRLVEKTDVTMLIEPLNSVDRPTYWLTKTSAAADYIRRLGSDNVKIMFDCYHVHTEERAIVENFERHRDSIGHIQVASFPGRNELDRGEVNYAEMFKLFEQHGWDGWVGLEYFPKAGTREGFGWLRRYESEGVTLADDNSASA